MLGFQVEASRRGGHRGFLEIGMYSGSQGLGFRV